MKNQSKVKGGNKVSFNYVIDFGSRISVASYLQHTNRNCKVMKGPSSNLSYNWAKTAFNKQLSVADAGCYVNVKVRRKCVKLNLV